MILQNKTFNREIDADYKRLSEIIASEENTLVHKPLLMRLCDYFYTKHEKCNKSNAKAYFEELVYKIEKHFYNRNQQNQQLC